MRSGPRAHAARSVPAAAALPLLHLYRKQVVKQADLVLALYLRGMRSRQRRRRNFEYYEALTVRDSLLSAFVQAVVAARSDTSN